MENSKSYKEIIKRLAQRIDKDFLNFEEPRTKASMPTQVSSEFITNKQQGDWAEELLLRAINGESEQYVAVKYGKSDDLIAGEEGFDKLYRDYQKELDEIGKRPDILIFQKKDFEEKRGYDISKDRCSHELDEYVSKAVAGIEVRSSSFLIDKYNEVNKRITEDAIEKAFKYRDLILDNYTDLLENRCEALIPHLKDMTRENIHIFSFKSHSWSSTPRLRELARLLSLLKSELKIIQRRDTLSITPKVEDLKVVYKWVMRYGVPHFYVQVFFDRVFGISFKEIMEMLSSAESLEGKKYLIEGDVKNQGKKTIKIPVNESVCIAQKVEEPVHKSERKELRKGRLLFLLLSTEVWRAWIKKAS